MTAMLRSCDGARRTVRLRVSAVLVGAALGLAMTVAVAAAQAAPVPAASEAALEADTLGAEIGPPVEAVIGKSLLLRLRDPVSRISIGNPAVADVDLFSSRELYLLGKTVGSTNVTLWGRSGRTTVIDVTVGLDTKALQAKLRRFLPTETDIEVDTTADSVVLTGRVSDAMKVARAVTIAEAFVRNVNRGLVLPVVAGEGRVEPGTRISVGDSRNVSGAVREAGARVVNLLQVADPQQVMLEVKVAEVSKTLLDKLGAEFRMTRSEGSWVYGLLTGFTFDPALGGVIGAVKNANNLISLEAEKRDGLIKILAEPNIMAISGQKGSFLAGGKVFIPVAREDSGRGVSITLEEKEFGIGLSFTPTVLEAGRINLVVAPEVSELSQTGSAFTTVNGVTSVLPSFTVRRASTTVQLNDGQSFAIAGLIKNNVSESVRAFPVLGELPILGPLFRSSEFQNDRSELLFVITPRLVKPLPADYALPTDGFVPPNRGEFMLEGRMEGHPPEAAPAVVPSGEPAPQGGGYELK